MSYRLILCLLCCLAACGLPPQLSEPWRGNPLDDQVDPSAVPPPDGPSDNDAGSGSGPIDGGIAPSTCGNGELDPGEDCDPEEAPFPCAEDCRFIDCAMPDSDEAGDAYCLSKADLDASPDPWHCVRLPGRSICAPVEETEVPDFLKKTFGRCQNEGGTVMVGEEEARCEGDQDCSNRFGPDTSCGFEIPDELSGICAANGFDPGPSWRPSETAILLGWRVHLPGHDASECYPMACDSDGDGKPVDFCKVLSSEALDDLALRTTCVGDLELDDGQRHGPNNEFALESEMCLLVECFPGENEDDNRNESCIQHYLIEDATCTGDGFCAARSEDLLLQNMLEGPGLQERCGEACRQDGAPGPDPMLLCHTQDREADGELVLGCSRCWQDGECPTGFVCDHRENNQEGFCRAACGNGFHCPPGAPAECREGRCYPGGGGEPQGLAQPCQQNGQCPEGHACHHDGEGGNGLCLPDLCGHDGDCPDPFVCVAGGRCEVIYIDYICQPGDDENERCGDYFSCRDLSDPQRPVCVSDLACDPNSNCPNGLHCIQGHCVGRGGGCENASVRNGVLRSGNRVCDHPDRDRPVPCLPEQDPPEGCSRCVESQWVADESPEPEIGICSDTECESTRDCPWGQLCLADQGHCIPSTLCGDHLPIGPAPEDLVDEPPRAVCPAGTFCAPRLEAVGPNTRICLMPMSCADDQACHQQHPQGICVAQRCMHPGYCQDGANNQDGVCLPINNEDVEGGGSLIFDGAEEDFHQIINLNGAVQTQIDGPRDADAFMFIAPAPGTYRFGTRHAHEGQGQLWADTGDFNTVCHLSMGGEIVRWNDDPPILDEEQDENTHCQVEIELQADQHAYLLIHAFDLWEEEDPTPHFEVYVECAEEGACGQEDDHGDVGDPTHIGELEGEDALTISGQINHRNDVDAFTFTAVHDGSATIGLDEAPSHLFLEVRASGAGNPILNSCEVAAAIDVCAAVVQVSNGSLYSVSVRGLNDAMGTYSLFARQGD